MTQRDLVDSLQDILEAIGAIERFTAGVDYASLVTNEEKVFAVEKAIEIIGEAVKNVPDSVRSTYPEIPWKNLAGMRDKLAHQYWRTDVDAPIHLDIIDDSNPQTQTHRYPLPHQVETF